MSRERLEEIIEKVKRIDEYAEKGLWEASDGKIVHLHNEGYINYLIERVQELEEDKKALGDLIEKTAKKAWDIEQQNKRYREALEEIKDEAEWMIKLNDNGKKFESILYRCEEALEEI